MPLSPDQETLEHEAKVQQMQADTANKNADTRLKDEQRRWEPWKALSAAFGAGIAFASALIGAAAWIASRFIH